MCRHCDNPSRMKISLSQYWRFGSAIASFLHFEQYRVVKEHCSIEKPCQNSCIVNNFLFISICSINLLIYCFTLIKYLYLLATTTYEFSDRHILIPHAEKMSGAPASSMVRFGCNYSCSHDVYVAYQNIAGALVF